MRKGTTFLAPIACVALLLTGCTPGGGSEAQNVLRIGTNSGIDSMNPFVGINQDAFSTWMQMYPSLLQTDTSKEDAPYRASLAEGWELSDDGLTLTFTIRDGAKWSDGETLDAEDAAWSLNVMHEYNESAAATWSIGSNITSITAPDPHTLVVTHAEPSALSINNLANTPLLPPQVWEQYATGDGEALKTYSNLPHDGKPVVSGGPFMLTKYSQGEVALFATNPNWYGEKPTINGFGIQTYKNADAMITALASGNLDAAFGIPPTGLETLESAKIVIDKGPALAMRDFIINSNPDKPKNRELLNLNVRQAMEHAIDRDEIVKTAWVDEAEPGSTIIAPVTASNGQQWHNDTVQTVPYDLDAANALLDAEGFVKGSDGIRSADGHQMSYEVVFADDESGPGDRAFQIIKADFEKIGIAISQRKLDSSASWDAIYCGEDCEYRDFDLAMWDWFPSQDPNFMVAALTCEQWGSWNDSGYCDEEYDALAQQQAKAVDPVERKRILDEIQQKIYNERPYIILTYDVRIDAWSPRWEGFVESSQGFFNNWSTQSLESIRRK